ncbi:MAG: Trp repressor protein [Firmicutes bacterium ADurb.Bin300]|jgi:TrpR-related protein YerC/YecD|nr:MAG: Trp repressor protein [Firmicutes bacterium ADurb.Bin300]HOD03086.1 YerC/YecD family TrpR-related protein [Clostridiales bacterium]
MNKSRCESTDYLFKAVLELKTIDECYDFFEDLCTVTELKAISQRIVVAKMLSDNRIYSEIVSETGASTATISRVNRSLQYGCDGYSVVFDRLKEKEKNCE